MKSRFLQAVPRLTGFVLLLAMGAAHGQTPAAPKAFDVASIKPSPAINQADILAGKPIHAGMKIDASRVDIGQYPVLALIMKAYDVKQYQVSGPDWLTSLTAGPRFDILAKMPDGATKDDVPEMLRTLLAERFKLVIHKETKDHPVYALVVGKSGPKLKDAEPLPAAPAATADGGPAPPASTGSNQVMVQATGKGAEISDGQGGKQTMSMAPDGKSMRIENSRMTMPQLAEGISPLLDRPVVDETGLKGQYQVLLDIPMEELMALAKKMGAVIPEGAGGGAGKPADAAADPSGGSIFNTMAQLGLKLESRKTQMVQIVVDQCEKVPTEN